MTTNWGLTFSVAILLIVTGYYAWVMLSKQSIQSFTQAKSKFVHPGSVMSVDATKKLQNLRNLPSSQVAPVSTWIATLLAVPTNVPSSASAVCLRSHHQVMMDAGESVYKCAIAYLYSGNPVFADSSIRIMNDWATINKSYYEAHPTYPGGNGPLEYGWMCASFAKAAEMLKYSYGAWTKDFENRFNAWVDAVALPLLKKNPNGGGNWCHTIDEARLQLAIFREDKAEFDKVIGMLKDRITQDIDKDGLIVETFRDMWHAQSGIGALVQACEIAWNQGVDLYATNNNALYKCVELHAQILAEPNTNPPIIQKYIDYSVANKTMSYDKYRWIHPLSFGTWPRQVKQRGYWPAGYEIALVHYQGRKNMQMPYTTKLTDQRRPEHYAFHEGYGTYTHYLTK